MSLKYQSEIDAFQLTSCPANVTPPPSEFDAFRFSFTPLSHDHNFLPNVVLDRMKNNPYNYQKINPDIKCLRCGSSFYISLEKAMGGWNKLGGQFKQNTGYTHIAQGKLNADDGVMSNPGDTGHFTFYENETADLKQKFNLVKEL